ncbi:MAG: hypothetical protein ACLFUS_04735, partial [Candidatus Sumerlaeia bacterium]
TPSPANQETTSPNSNTTEPDGSTPALYKGTAYLIIVANFRTLNHPVATKIALDLRDGSGQIERDNSGRPKSWQRITTSDKPFLITNRHAREWRRVAPKPSLRGAFSFDRTHSLFSGH